MKIRTARTDSAKISRYLRRLETLKNTKRTFINGEHIRQQIRTVQSFIRTLRELRDKHKAEVEELKREISLLKMKVGDK